MVDVERIHPRVARIRLPLPLEGLTSVNCYVLTGDDEVALVDPGWSSPETERALLSGLDELGVDTGSIGRILTTHHHWDHYTQAITWQRTRDVPTYLGAGDGRSIAAWRDLDGAFPRQVGLLRRAGADVLADEIAAIPVEPHERAMDFEEPAHWITDGEEVDLGGLRVRAIATPGHTRGHVCFEVVGQRLLLTGDHVLPRITPSIAYERAPDPRSLTSYLSSLHVVTQMRDHALLPAHGTATGTAAQRAEELLAHHDGRLEVIDGLVASGLSSAYEVAAAMRWTRHERSLADLEPIHRMTAVLEAAAHLEHLAAHAAVHVDREGDVDRFTRPGAADAEVRTPVPA